MNQIELLLAKAQIRLAHWTLFAFIMLLGGLIVALYFPPSNNQQTIVTMLTSLLAALATIFTLQMNYFFARNRPGGIPDPTASEAAPPPVPKSPVPPVEGASHA